MTEVIGGVVVVWRDGRPVVVRAELVEALRRVGRQGAGS